MTPRAYLALAAAGLASCALAAPESARITSVPGLSNFPSFAMYSGYTEVQKGHRNFYWLVEAASNAAQAPLVVWYTGGPGCSGLYALMTEHGPFRPSSIDPTVLETNPFSWNAVANVLYIEQPTGVGFSVADDGNYTTGDDAAAADNYAFLSNWLADYPEFRGRRALLAGESYGGHYVPQLAALLAAKPIQGFNFSGWMVGNPSFDGYYDSQNYWTFMAYHALVGSSTYQRAVATCNGTFAGTLSPACSSALNAIQQEFIYLNPYNVEANCDGPPSLDGSCFTAQAALADAGAQLGGGLGAGLSAQQRTAARFSSPTSIAQTVVPCMNVTPTVIYFSQPAVRAALHVDPAAHVWDVCSVYVNYTQYAASVSGIYESLAGVVDILVYSGDTDSCVPYLGTEAAVDSLTAVEEDPSRPYRRWFIYDAANNKQVAGYVKNYVRSGAAKGGAGASSSSSSHSGQGGLGGGAGTGDGVAAPPPALFAYATVKDAGHMVPTYQPQAALELFKAFISGGQFPTS